MFLVVHQLSKDSFLYIWESKMAHCFKMVTQEKNNNCYLVCILPSNRAPDICQPVNTVTPVHQKNIIPDSIVLQLEENPTSFKPFLPGPILPPCSFCLPGIWRFDAQAWGCGDGWVSCSLVQGQFPVVVILNGTLHPQSFKFINFLFYRRHCSKHQNISYIVFAICFSISHLLDNNGYKLTNCNGICLNCFPICNVFFVCMSTTKSALVGWWVHQVIIPRLFWASI